jgi:hypothetical protein
MSQCAGTADAQCTVYSRCSIDKCITLEFVLQLSQAVASELKCINMEVTSALKCALDSTTTKEKLTKFEIGSEIINIDELE